MACCLFLLIFKLLICYFVRSNGVMMPGQSFRPVFDDDIVGNLGELPLYGNLRDPLGHMMVSRLHRVPCWKVVIMPKSCCSTSCTRDTDPLRVACMCSIFPNSLHVLRDHYRSLLGSDTLSTSDSRPGWAMVARPCTLTV